MDTSCDYCESDVTTDDPVTVATGVGVDQSLEGQFCNYTCLQAWIDEEDKASGGARGEDD